MRMWTPSGISLLSFPGTGRDLDEPGFVKMQCEPRILSRCHPFICSRSITSFTFFVATKVTNYILFCKSCRGEWQNSQLRIRILISLLLAFPKFDFPLSHLYMRKSFIMTSLANTYTQSF